MEKNAADPAFQFVAHEMKIRRMKGNITVLRPHLSGEQASDITELIIGHEEIIEARKRLVLDHLEPPVPEIALYQLRTTGNSLTGRRRSSG